MKYKKVAVIINPHSGQAYPVLFHLNRFFKRHKLEWQPFITLKAGDAFKYAREISQGGGYEVVATYGGDGTVMEVAKEIIHTELPLLILPGGTGNVIAKEFLIPQDPSAALELLLYDKSKTFDIDTIKTPHGRFVIRASMGIFEKVITGTSRKSKASLGNLAYTLAALEAWGKSKSMDLELIADGKKLKLSGQGIMVTNIANVGLEGISAHPKISAVDGKLDILVLKQTDLTTLAGLAAKTLLSRDPVELEHYQASKVTIKAKKPVNFLLDDQVIYDSEIELINHPRSLKLLIPVKPTVNNEQNHGKNI